MTARKAPNRAVFRRNRRTFRRSPPSGSRPDRGATMDLTPSLQATPWGNAWGLRLFGWGRGRCEDLRCPLWVLAVGNSGAQTDPSRDFLSLTDALPTFDKGCLCDTGVRAKVNSPSVFVRASAAPRTLASTAAWRCSSALAKLKGVREGLLRIITAACCVPISACSTLGE